MVTQRRRAGGVEYAFTRKQVKNLNLRVGEDGSVRVSAPFRVPLAEVDRFVEERADWIAAARARYAARPQWPVPPECGDRAWVRQTLEEAVERMYPLVAGAGVDAPRLRVRRMTSRWGSCLYRKGVITLNSALAACPAELRDYVALHELVHFLHPNHSPAFHRAMGERMPDWKLRRKRLAEYGSLLGRC